MRYTNIPSSAFLKDVFDTMFGEGFRKSGGEQSCVTCHTEWGSYQCRAFAYMLAAADISVDDLNAPEACRALGFKGEGGLLWESHDKQNGLEVNPYCMPCITYKDLLALLQRLWREKHPDKP